MVAFKRPNVLGLFYGQHIGKWTLCNYVPCKILDVVDSGNGVVIEGNDEGLPSKPVVLVPNNLLQIFKSKEDAEVAASELRAIVAKYAADYSALELRRSAEIRALSDRLSDADMGDWLVAQGHLAFVDNAEEQRERALYHSLKLKYNRNGEF